MFPHVVSHGGSSPGVKACYIQLSSLVLSHHCLFKVLPGGAPCICQEPRKEPPSTQGGVFISPSRENRRYGDTQTPTVSHRPQTTTNCQCCFHSRMNTHNSASPKQNSKCKLAQLVHLKQRIYAINFHYNLTPSLAPSNPLMIFLFSTYR